MTTEENSLLDRLAAPFAFADLKFFPVATTQDGKKGKVGTYADVRTYMDRLDEVMGLGGWSTAYRCVDPADKTVECILSLRVDGEWVARADVGYPNDARDTDNASKEAWKAAYSDALKRAAVQWGVGRFLYTIELEQDWLPIEKVGSITRFTESPRLKGAPRQQQSTVAQRTEPAAPNGQVAGSIPAGAPTNPSKQQLGQFIKNGQPDYAKFRNYLNDKAIQSDSIRLVVPVADASAGLKGSDFTAWLADNPMKSLLDLEKLIAQTVRDREAVPA